MQTGFVASVGKLIAGGVLSLAMAVHGGRLVNAQEPAAPPAAEAAPAEAPAEKPATEAPAAEAPAAEASAAEAPAPNPAAKGEFETALNAWKEKLKELRSLKLRYQTAKPEDQAALQEEWTKSLAATDAMIPDLTAKAIAAYQAAPNSDPQLTRFLVKLAADNVQHDQYDLAYDISTALIANNCDDKTIYDIAGCSAYAISEFELADKYLTMAREAGTISRLGEEWSFDVKDQIEQWKKEQEIRKAEEKSDLPRVKFETSQGTIVLELFENEAPDTVGNFISLVEKKFYDGLSFHRVIANFMAQGGDPQGDGSGGPGYEIFCECHQENYRRHFRGSLSMAHAGRDTGGSQFFITFRPTGALNGRHTCFGRVIEGMDVLTKLKRGEPPTPAPDTILKAEVVRKRDHAYAPKKVQ